MWYFDVVLEVMYKYCIPQWRWETSYIIILRTNRFRTMKIRTYLFDTRGHTYKDFIINFICHIYLFDPCLLHVSKEEETFLDFGL